MCLLTLLLLGWFAFKEKEVGEDFARWPRLGQEETAPFTRKQRHHRDTERGLKKKKGKKKIKHPGMTEIPSWSITLRFPIHFGKLS